MVNRDGEPVFKVSRELHRFFNARDPPSRSVLSATRVNFIRGETKKLNALSRTNIFFLSFLFGKQYPPWQIVFHAFTRTVYSVQSRSLIFEHLLFVLLNEPVGKLREEQQVFGCPDSLRRGLKIKSARLTRRKS